jgi:hypothetical protein
VASFGSTAAVARASTHGSRRKRAPAGGLRQPQVDEVAQELAKRAGEIRICKGSSIYLLLKEAKVAGLVAGIRQGKETLTTCPRRWRRSRRGKQGHACRYELGQAYGVRRSRRSRAAVPVFDHPRLPRMVIATCVNRAEAHVMRAADFATYPPVLVAVIELGRGQRRDLTPFAHARPGKRPTGIVLNQSVLFNECHDKIIYQYPTNFTPMLFAGFGYVIDHHAVKDAVIAADHLSDMAGHLIGHFVRPGPERGASWTKIGAEHRSPSRWPRSVSSARIRPGCQISIPATDSAGSTSGRSVVMAAQEEAPDGPRPDPLRAPGAWAAERAGRRRSTSCSPCRNSEGARAAHRTQPRQDGHPGQHRRCGGRHVRHSRAAMTLRVRYRCDGTGQSRGA